MITNFEDITKELSEEDYSLVTQLLRAFENRTKANAIKAPAIVKAMNDHNPNLKSKFTQVKLRKLVNFIRSKGMIGLIATSDGYYSTKNIAEIQKQIQSLQERSDAINNSAEGLKIVIERYKKQQHESNNTR